MAFATEYYVSWMDVEGVSWDIYFQQEGGDANAEELTPGITPLVITWNGSEKYQTIVGSNADIQIVYESAVDELYTETSHTTKVLVQRDSTVIWRGWLTPGQYYKQFNQPVHYVTLSANDGFGELKNIKFEDGSGDPYFGQATEMAVISNILAKIDPGWTFIMDAVNIFDANHTTGAAYSPLNQTYLYQEAYWDEQTDERANCDVVLEDILKKYGAHIRQGFIAPSYTGVYILRTNSYCTSPIYVRIFSLAGVYQSNTSYTSYDFTASDLQYLYADAEVRKIPGIGGCEVTQNPPRRSNMIKNGSFDSFTWDSGVPIYWDDVYSSGTTLNIEESGDKLKIGACGNSSTPTEYIEYSTTVDYATSVNLSLDWTPTFTGSPTYKNLVLQIYSVTFAKYLVTAGTWQSGVGYVSFTGGASGTEIHESIDIPDEGTGFGRGNTLRIRIYEFYCEQNAATNYALVNNVRLDVEMSKPETRLHSYDNSISINNTDKKEIAWGDSWRSDFGTSTTDYSYFINTYAASVTGSLTTLWSITGDPTAAAKIGEVLARQTVEGYRRSLDSISATLRGQQTNLSYIAIRDSNFEDEYGWTKYFFPTQISLDARRNEWSGEWIECPATYTDESIEWASSDYADYSITADSIEVNSSAGNGTATSDPYTAVAGETVRVIIVLTDDGSSDIPSCDIGGTAETLVFGTNRFTVRFSTAGAKTVVLGGDDAGDNHNYTATITFYSITGV